MQIWTIQSIISKDLGGIDPHSMGWMVEKDDFSVDKEISFNPYCKNTSHHVVTVGKHNFLCRPAHFIKFPAKILFWNFTVTHELWLET